MSSTAAYCQYLLSSQKNYTLTHYAEHVAGVSHDSINRYLREIEIRPQALWEQVKDGIITSPNGFIVFDDTVLDKRYSRAIEPVRSQYSGNAHGIIKGIGVVTCIYVNPETDQFWAIDWRLFDPDTDGKTKVDHVEDMLRNAHDHKNLPYRAILMDTWYATKRLMLLIHEDLHKLFYCPLKSNRLVDDSGNTRPYRAVGDLDWSDDERKGGKCVKIKDFPGSYKVQLFRVPVSTSRACPGEGRGRIMSRPTTGLVNLRMMCGKRAPTAGRSSSCTERSSKPAGLNNASAEREESRETISPAPSSSGQGSSRSLTKPSPPSIRSSKISCATI